MPDCRRIIFFVATISFPFALFAQINSSRATVNEHGNQTKYSDHTHPDLRGGTGVMQPQTGNDAPRFYNEGVKMDVDNNYEEAIKLYSKAIEAYPTHKNSYFNRAVDKYKLEDFNGAIEDFTKVIEIDSLDKTAYFNRAYCRFYLDSTTQACSDWKKSYKLGCPEANEEITKFCSDGSK